MPELTPALVVEAIEPTHGRRTLTTFLGRSISIAGDSRVEHGGQGTGPDGFDLVSAALGQCLLTTLLAKAQADGVQLTGARVVVSTKSRLRGSRGAPYLSDFDAEIVLEGDIDEATRVVLAEHAERFCGVRETLLRMPRIDARVRVER